MRSFILVVMTLLFSSFASASALKVPLTLEGKNDVNVSVFEVNALLKKAHLKRLPTMYKIDGDLDINQPFDALDAKIKSASDSLGIQFSRARELNPGQRDTPTSKTCYTGKATDIPDMLFNLQSVIYYEATILHAYKYKNQSGVFTGITEADDLVQIPLWKNWRGKGEAILLIYTLTDDDDGFVPVILPRCVR